MCLAREVRMRRVIGIDIHRTFGGVVFWEDGRLRRAGRIDMTRTALEGFGKRLLASDEVVIEATVLCWHLLTKGEDYQWARPALVANKTRAMQLQAGHSEQKGSRRGPAYAYNIKALRDREMLIAAEAERSYEQFVSQWKPRRPKTGARAPQ